MKLEVKTVDAEEYVLYFHKNIKLGNITIETPIKAVDLTKIKNNITFNPKMRGLNEIYKRLNQESIKKILYDPKRQDSFNWNLNYLLKKSEQNELNLLLLEFESDKYPNKKELEFIVDTTYSYSDIVTLPIISSLKKRITDKRSFEKYLGFIKSAINIIETQNNKSLMGIVPPIVAPYIPDLIEFYIENGIKNYFFDFDGKTPLSMRQNMRGFMRTLGSNKILEETFIHSINLNYGRFNKDAPIIGGKDILSFGMGIDSLGERHKPLRLPQDFFKKLGDRKEQKMRLFNKDDYGYYRLKRMQIDKIYPNDTNINLSLFKSENVKNEDVQKIFNMEQLGLESVRLRKVIKENATKKYISKKSQVNKTDLKQIERIKKDILGPKQQKLKIE